MITQFLFKSTSEVFKRTHLPFVPNPVWLMNQLQIWRYIKKIYFVWGKAGAFQLKIDGFTLKCLPSLFAAVWDHCSKEKAWPMGHSRVNTSSQVL